MATRPAYVWTGSDFDEIGDKRLGPSVTALNAALAAKLDYPTGGSDGDLLAKDGTDAEWIAPPSSGLNFMDSDTFTSSSSLSINGCFTSAFDNYKIIIDSTSTGATINLRLRASGVDDSSSNYDMQILEQSGTTTTGVRFTDQISIRVGVNEDDCGITDLLITNPAKAQNTGFSGNYANSPGAILAQVGGVHTVASAFDGFTLLFGAVSTGTVRIYGYRNS